MANKSGNMSDAWMKDPDAFAQYIESAARDGDVLTVCQLLKKDPRPIATHLRQGNVSELILACALGYEQCVRLLMQGMSVDGDDGMGKMPLHYAALYGNASVCAALLESNLNVNAVDGYEVTPLMMAGTQGHHACVRILLEDDRVDAHAVDIHEQSALVRAIKKGHWECVKLLCTVCDMQRCNVEGKTLLHHGASVDNGDLQDQQEQLRVMQKLMCHVDVECLDNLGRTALHYAAESMSTPLAVVQLLTTAKTVNVQDAYGKSALHLAAKSGCVQKVHYLMEHTDMQALSNSKGSALEFAAAQGHLECVKVLWGPSDGKARWNAMCIAKVQYPEIGQWMEQISEAQEQARQLDGALSLIQAHKEQKVPVPKRGL